jgi:hypothetical protein
MMLGGEELMGWKAWALLGFGWIYGGYYGGGFGWVVMAIWKGRSDPSVYSDFGTKIADELGEKYDNKALY